MAVCDSRDISLIKEILINHHILWHILMVLQSAYSKKKRESLGKFGRELI